MTVATRTASGSTSQRRDAVRNRRRVLEAAAVEVRHDGGEMSMCNVAKRAGVGAGTVYRHFPEREQLLRAAALQVVDELAAQLTLRRKADRSAHGFYGAVIDVALSFAHSRAAADVLSLAGDEPHPLGALAAPLAQMLRDGQAAGTVRRELDNGDLWPLTVMAAAVCTRAGREALSRCLWLFCAPADLTAGAINEEEEGSWN